jgi:DNA-binding response OmpR family regulator
MEENHNQKGKKLILLVEDEITIATLMKLRLEEAGYEVITASDGFLAISFARSKKPDLILLDLMLPKLDGFTVCKLIKSSDTTKNIPIIAVTARVSPQDMERGFEVGCDAYLTKPTDFPTLLNKISELLKNKNETSPPESSKPE